MQFMKSSVRFTFLENSYVVKDRLKFVGESVRNQASPVWRGNACATSIETSVFVYRITIFICPITINSITIQLVLHLSFLITYLLLPNLYHYYSHLQSYSVSVSMRRVLVEECPLSTISILCTFL